MEIETPEEETSSTDVDWVSETDTKVPTVELPNILEELIVELSQVDAMTCISIQCSRLLGWNQREIRTGDSLKLDWSTCNSICRVAHVQVSGTAEQHSNLTITLLAEKCFSALK